MYRVTVKVHTPTGVEVDVSGDLEPRVVSTAEDVVEAVREMTEETFRYLNGRWASFFLNQCRLSFSFEYLE